MSLAADRTAHASPYKGLASFAAEDAAFFFGRDRERDVVIANLRARSLTVLYGESGAGKSSLLQAGVLSRLREQADESRDDQGVPEFIPVMFGSWAEDPVAGLLGAIRAAVSHLIPGRSLPDVRGARLSDWLSEWTGELGSEFFIILDQFEEYFLYHGQEEGQETFAFQFAEAVNRPGMPASFLLSIREDAFAKLDRFKTLVPTLLDNYLRVRHLDERSARAAIQGPLDAWNRSVPEEERVEADPSLVDAVISEVRAGAAADERTGRGAIEGNGRVGDEGRIEAPYLQLVLTRLWDEEMKQGSKRLRPATLEELGGAKHIVQKHLDEAMRVLPPEDQRVAAAVFHYLVTPEGTKIAQSVQSLAVYSGCAAKDIERVMDKLASEDTRIVRPMAPPPDAAGGTRYVIFHDVLGPAILDWRARHEQARLERQKREADRKREEAERRHRDLLAATERRRRLHLLAVALAALTLSLVLYATDALDSLELETVDTRFEIRGEHAGPADLLVVGIDETTLSDFQRYRYPFPRRFHARVIDRLNGAGAKLIVYDVEFSGQGKRSEDARLVAAMRRARPVILGVTALDEITREPNFLGRQGAAFAAGARPASVLVPPDSTVRKFRYEENELKTVGIAAAETLAGRMIEPSEVGDDIWIDYVGPTGTIPHISFSQVRTGDFPPDAFRDKVVVIGGTALNLQDRHLTSMGGDLMSGAEIQANAIATARRLAPLESTAGAWTVILIVLFSILPPLLALLTRPVVAFGVAVGLFVLYLALVQYVFSHGWILPLAYPAVAFVVALFGTVGLLRSRASA